MGQLHVGGELVVVGVLAVVVVGLTVIGMVMVGGAVGAGQSLHDCGQYRPMRSSLQLLASTPVANSSHVMADPVLPYVKPVLCTSEHVHTPHVTGHNF